MYMVNRMIKIKSIKYGNNYVCDFGYSFIDSLVVSILQSATLGCFVVFIIVLQRTIGKVFF